MSAWDDAQTDPVKEIEAGVWKQMEGRSASDPAAPWADLALALCQRIATAESESSALRSEVERLTEALEFAAQPPGEVTLKMVRARARAALSPRRDVGLTEGSTVECGDRLPANSPSQRRTHEGNEEADR